MRDLRQICCIRMNRDRRSANAVFLELSPIGKCDQRHHDAAFFNDAIRTGECFFAHWIEHSIDIPGDVFESGLCVIDCQVCAELLKQVLICR